VATKINFVKNFYKSKSLSLSSQRLVNMYAEIEPQETRVGSGEQGSPIALFECAGLRTLLTVPTYAPVHALKTMGNYLYAVVGNKLYQIDDSFTATLKGTIPLSSNKVRLSVNNTGIDLVVLAFNGSSWIYNSTADTFTQITDGDYQDASDVTSIDGYSVFSKLDSDQFFNSDLRVPSSYNALNFQTAEGEPDNLVAIRTVSGEIWNIGEKTIEIYRNVGGNPIFARIDGTTIRIGCLTRDSVSVLDSEDTIFWLGSDKMIYAARGYKKQKISTFPIDQELESYSITELENCTSFTYSSEGHKYYVITFPDKERTFTFDLTTGLWHERESYDNNTHKVTRWRANCSADFNGRRIMGDYQTGILYYLDNTYHKEGENRMIVKMVISPLFNSFLRTKVTALYVDIETGAGITSGEGSDPKLMLQISKDGGHTYGSEIWRDIGKIGEYRTRVKITPIGSSDNFTFKIAISDPIKRYVLGGYISYEVGTE